MSKYFKINMIFLFATIISVMIAIISTTMDYLPNGDGTSTDTSAVTTLAIFILVITLVSWLFYVIKYSIAIAETDNAIKTTEIRRGNSKYSTKLHIHNQDLIMLRYPLPYRRVPTLVRSVNNTVHFAYPNSPDMLLIHIDFKSIMGTFGSGYGSSNGDNGFSSMSVSTREMTRPALLTFRILNNNQILKIQADMTQQIEYSLEQYFM